MIPEWQIALVRAGWSPPRELRTIEMTREAIVTLTVVDANGCWVWQRTTRNGYGYLWGKHAHRAAYEAFIGPIPKGFHVDHICRNRACVHPGPPHTEPVTQAENNRRAMTYVQKHPGERVHQAARRWCVNGHPFDEENTGRDARGRRYCKKCNHEATRKTRRERGQMPRGRQWHIDEGRWAERRSERLRSGPTVTRAEFAEMAEVKPEVLRIWFVNHPNLIAPLEPQVKPLRYYRAEVEALIECRSDENWPKTGPNMLRATAGA